MECSSSFTKKPLSSTAFIKDLQRQNERHQLRVSHLTEKLTRTEENNRVLNNLYTELNFKAQGYIKQAQYEKQKNRQRGRIFRGRETELLATLEHREETLRNAQGGIAQTNALLHAKDQALQRAHQQFEATKDSLLAQLARSQHSEQALEQSLEQASARLQQEVRTAQQRATAFEREASVSAEALQLFQAVLKHKEDEMQREQVRNRELEHKAESLQCLISSSSQELRLLKDVSIVGLLKYSS